MEGTVVRELPRDGAGNGLKAIPIQIDRYTLQKRRWRAQAEDGFEVAVIFKSPIKNGEVVYVRDDVCYVVEQLPEKVIVLPLPQTPLRAARAGWVLGNQHLPIEIRNKEIRVGWIASLESALTRDRVSFQIVEEVFFPEPHCVPAHQHVS